MTYATCKGTLMWQCHCYHKQKYLMKQNRIGMCLFPIVVMSLTRSLVPTLGPWSNMFGFFSRFLNSGEVFAHFLSPVRGYLDLVFFQGQFARKPWLPRRNSKRTDFVFLPQGEPVKLLVPEDGFSLDLQSGSRRDPCRLICSFAIEMLFLKHLFLSGSRLSRDLTSCLFSRKSL